ncbi:MAG: hypothetical protein Greene101447_423 [Parcubacteria group bacterium Greene1014_47]|nr:MAG: hypothetical protein Greene101447_423 [Parcubacteria group bacterium Greene1014_47]
MRDWKGSLRNAFLTPGGKSAIENIDDSKKIVEVGREVPGETARAIENAVRQMRIGYTVKQLT